MRLPSSRKKLLRNYSNSLFYNPTEKKSERIYIFYLILRPCLSWLAKEIISKGLEKPEVESEIYIMCAEIFEKFNKNKSSIVPYTERAISWFSSKLLKEIDKKLKILYVYNNENNICQTQEEIDLHPIKILFSNIFFGKHFTREEKYLISIVLTLDYDKLTKEELAKKLNINRKTIYDKIENLKLALVDGGY